MFTEDQKLKLRQPMPKEHVATVNKGSGKLSYLEGWRAFQVLNEIFGPDGWTYMVNETAVYPTRNEEKGRLEVEATALVTVTAGGVMRMDVGGGTGMGREAYTNALKEAVTDAVKRAARGFGWPLGLALYDKQQANVGDPPSFTEDAVKTSLGLCQTKDEVVDYFKSLPEGDRKAYRALIQARKDELA